MNQKRTQFCRYPLFLAVLPLLFSIDALALQSAGKQQHALKPLLRCHVTYAGSTHEIDTFLTQDPYQAPLIDIDGRFQFKAVMAGTEQSIAYIKLYAYLQTRNKDIPVHQASFLPPFKVTKSPVQLTPHNYLYAGEVERELQYHCTLQGVKQ